MNDIIVNGMTFSLPLFIIAVGGIYSERSGVTNLALEGFQGAGAFFGAVFVTLTSGMFAATSQLPMYLALLVSMLGGALYAVVHAVLCIRFKANQVISGVVVNILAMALTDFLTSQINSGILGQSSDKFVLTVSGRWTIQPLASIPVIGGFFTNVYPFELIIIAVALVAWYAMYRTRFGMRLRACGDNPYAVDAAGCNVARLQFSAVLISGALSGLGGMCFALLGIRQLLHQHLHRLRLSGHRGHDLRQLEDSPDAGRLLPVRLCPGGRLFPGAGTGHAQHLLRPDHDPALCPDPAAAGVLLQEQPCAPCPGEIYDKGKR